MKDLKEFNSKIQFLFTDIDDTLTDEGLLKSEAYSSLWKLSEAGIKVIPVTGRPAGWCEMIVRQWPVAGVIGENGGFYFRYFQQKMIRNFEFDFETQIANRKKLDQIRDEVLAQIPGSALASDQFCRLMDLAIDFCEDVPRLPEAEVDRIVAIFKRHGAHAKISSIHVNGWFGDYNKVSKVLQFLDQEFGIKEKEALAQSAFIGDSPNDESLFEKFPMSFAVANISNFLGRLKHRPAFVAKQRGGFGFQEISEQILKNLK